MPQTTILALGNTVGTSSNVTLTAGQTATLAAFHAAGQAFNMQFAEFRVQLISPGEPVLVGVLDATRRALQVSGPGVYRVLRPKMGQAFGVSSDV